MTLQFAASVTPDAEQTRAFFAALFPADGLLHFRAVPEPARADANGHKEPPRNLHYMFDATFPNTVAGFLDWCNVDGRAAFYLPGFVQTGGTGKADVLMLPAVLADFDKGDPAANLAAAEGLIGPASIVVESGGQTDNGPKLHAYWKLAAPATGGDIDLACRVREEVARRFGGDPAFKQAAQVIRVPGSVHHKSGAKLVKLRDVRPHVYALADIAAKLAIRDNQTAKVDNYFDFSADRPAPGLDRALTQPIHEGATDELTRFEGAGQALGHFIRMVREGRYSLDEAWAAAKDWNAATLVPPWDEARLRNDFERLVRIDHDAHGPVVPPVFLPTAEQGWAITDWRADRFQGVPPERKWLVEGLIPAAVPGVFAAVGDAGKSMMALRLALVVASHPPCATTKDSPAGINDTPNFFGRPITARGAAVILTAEDDGNEVHRRLHSLDPSNLRSGRPLYVVPMLAAGGPRAILRDGSNGPEPTPFWYELKKQLVAIPDLRLVVLDPLSSFMLADTNDNTAGSSVMTMLGELATATGASVMVVHHFAKSTTPTSLSDARTAIRGAGSLVDNGRYALALWEAGEDEAYSVLKALGRTPSHALPAGLVYFGGLAKGNAPGEKTLRTLVRNTSTGLLEDVTDALRAATPRADEVDDLLFKALRAHKNNHPRYCFPASVSSIEKFVVPVLRRAKVDLSVRKAKESCDRLIERGQLVEVEGGGTPKYEPVMI